MLITQMQPIHFMVPEVRMLCLPKNKSRMFHFYLIKILSTLISNHKYLSLGADETPGPVKWIRPYFDCGRSNTWKYAAVVPIVDIYPRHTQFRHIEYPSYVAASVMEIDFERIDINQVGQ